MAFSFELKSLIFDFILVKLTERRKFAKNDVSTEFVKIAAAFMFLVPSEEPK